MADDNVLTPEVQDAPETQVVDEKAQLDFLMNRALGINQPEVQVQEPIVNEPEVVPPVVQEPVFGFDVLKEKFGYEKPEDVLTEIEQLRAFKATPPTPAELKFENEQSKKLFEAIQAGKSVEVGEILAQQSRLERLSTMEVTPQTAAEIIKAGMQLKLTSLTPEMIEHKFNRTYQIPKQPIQGVDEEPEEYQERLEEYQAKKKDVEMDMLVDASAVKPDILAAKSKLVLPEIAQNVDQDYLDWKAEQAELATSTAQVYEAYKVFKNEDVKFEQDFIDEPNKVNTKINYTPSAEAFKKAQEMVTDLDKFFDMYKNSDGSPNRKGFISHIARLVDEKAFVASVAKQAVNAYIKGQLPDNLNDNLGRQNANAIVEESELDRRMRLAGITKGG